MIDCMRCLILLPMYRTADAACECLTLVHHVYQSVKQDVGVMLHAGREALSLAVTTYVATPVVGLCVDAHCPGSA